ncbi:MAG TPA: flagellar biosynthesis anti-sigma factor FlgM [Succinivibrionaceae bacterium]|jgi:negative regulator of flagellin synthesis FlgM|nr:flagellar biosynthesis anti-sigma factor FlgM [Succinivibrio sp.]HAR79962.1 flagellar biosynthesis anti-sigma factor FlgM [Succinivibrionaceae bacterium]
MAIDILSDRSMNGLQESVANANRTAIANKAATTAATKGDAASASATRADAVVLTDSAKSLAKATEKAKASDGIDHAKVDKLKKEIQDGSYKVNYESVASKLIDAEDELSAIFG